MGTGWNKSEYDREGEGLWSAAVRKGVSEASGTVGHALCDRKIDIMSGVWVLYESEARESERVCSKE